MQSTYLHVLSDRFLAEYNIIMGLTFSQLK